MTVTDGEPRVRLPEYRCSPWTHAQGVDPIGSAGSFDQLLLVEWPLPWPADVSEIPALAEAAGDGRARVMAVVPRVDDAEADGLLRVVHHRRAGTHRFAGVDHRVPRAHVPALLADLLDHPEREQHDWSSVVGDAPPEVLVCGHGRRDPCCGRWGTLLHVELAARQTGLRVWRCSHTGGHRFAPTAITLPDGRAWAYVDADVISDIVHRRSEPADLHDHDRGSSALDPWAQVLERAVLAERGWAWLDQRDLTVRTVVSDDGDRADVTMSWPGGTASGQVTITRTLPVLVCGQPPEMATKQSPEYALSRFELH